MFKKLLLLASAFLACQSSAYALTILDGFELGVTNVKSYVNAKRKVCKVSDLQSLYLLDSNCYGIPSLSEVGIFKKDGVVIVRFEASVANSILQSLTGKYGTAHQVRPNGTHSWYFDIGAVYFNPPGTQGQKEELSVTYIPRSAIQSQNGNLKGFL